MEHELLICQCESAEHQVVFSWIEEDGCGDVWMSVHLKSHGFWERLKAGVKHIFGYKCKYGNFDEMVFKKEDVAKLERVVEYLKREDGIEEE